MKNNVTLERIDKIDFEDLIKDFRVINLDDFTSYLKEIWKVYIKFKKRIFHKEQRKKKE